MVTDKKPYLNHKNFRLQNICIIRIKDEIRHCISRESNLRCRHCIRDLQVVNWSTIANNINNLYKDWTQMSFQCPATKTNRPQLLTFWDCWVLSPGGQHTRPWAYASACIPHTPTHIANSVQTLQGVILKIHWKTQRIVGELIPITLLLTWLGTTW